jgi:hypothetical protein
LNLAAYGGRRAIELFLICQEDCLAQDCAVCLLKHGALILAGGEPENHKSGQEVINTHKAMLLPNPPK